MGDKLKNLALIYSSVSSGYKDELRTYAGLNSVNVPNDALPPNAFAIFVKMFFLFSKLGEGHIDLATVTYGDLSTLGEDIASIAVAVENGYLASVTGADLLTTEM